MLIKVLYARSVVVAALAPGFLFATAAQAQDEPALSADETESAGLDVIVVTAQKREENLQRVPTTITALGSEALETRQIDDVVDLQTEVPSLFVGQYYGTSIITLRGISTTVTSGAEDPSVATHINGAYQPRSRTVDSAMADLERVEVLSGPQGTLYGRNATGGVINYILQRPGNEFEGEITAGVRNYEGYGVKARASGPLSDSVGLLVSGIFDKQAKGFTRNLLPNAPRSRFEQSRAVGGRVALDLEVSPAINVELDAIYLDTRFVPTASAFSAPKSPALAAFLGTQSFKPHEVVSERNSIARTKYFQTIGAVTFDLSDSVSLKSITAFQTFRDEMSIDLDASAEASVPIRQNLNSESFTQELTLTAGLFDDRLQTIVGAFYYDDDFLGTSITDFSVPGFAGQFATSAKILTKSYAAFTDNTFSVSDRFRLLAGLRFNRDEKTATQFINFNGFPVCPQVTNNKVSEAWTPRFGAQFDVNDDTMVYGQWSRGFKSGGFVSNSCADDYDPEKIKGPEVGLKTTLFDNRLRFNLAGFYYEISDLQVQKVVGVSDFLVENAGAAEIYGAEFSLVAAPADGLQLDASGILQSAKYTQFDNCDQTAFIGACSAFDLRPVAARNVSVAGNRLNRAPPYTLNLGVQYTFPIAGAGDLLIRGESFFSGKVNFSEFPVPETVQPAYSLQNIFVTYTAPGDRYIIRAFVRNIADKDYKVASFFQTAITQFQGNWGAPRTFGVEGTVRF